MASPTDIPPITPRTRLYGVLGDPVSHSLSPLMHNAAFHQTGFDGVYVAFHIKDPAGAVAGIRALNVSGCSVTIPHKVAIMALLDAVDPVARQIGAVNTIVNDAGRLVGLNSDSPGRHGRAIGNNHRGRQTCGRHRRRWCGTGRGLRYPTPWRTADHCQPQPGQGAAVGR